MRYTYSTIPTTFRFTGQRLESSLNLYWYGSRWYDPTAARFIQADSIVPEEQGVQAWDRYAYTNNNPVKYTDPSGHKMVCDPEDPNCNQEARHEQVRSAIAPRPKPTPYLIPTITPTPEPMPTLTPLPPQAQMTQWAASENQTYISAPQPTASVPSEAEPLSVKDLLSYLRQITGEFDPFTPDAFTGTSTGVKEMINYSSEYIRLTNPNSSIPKVLEFIPAVSFVYDFTYDQITRSGEYSDIPINFHTVAYSVILTSVYLAIP